ncbi:hypothetical protein [Polaromonas glacialis]|uniref:hypothetical protein n=1 Tax=Polaromonas glacialis TaxID=866564 RepID=UPI00049508BF|nr:hypothetical protein [Polaromonas glacialis]
MAPTSLPPPHPVTPDRRYFVVRGRLWRMANPELPGEERAQLVADLMRARREVGKALRSKDADAERLARQAVEVAKHSLGERGPPWWRDGAPDYNRRMVRNTPYAQWFAMLDIE